MDNFSACGFPQEFLVTVEENLIVRQECLIALEEFLIFKIARTSGTRMDRGFPNVLNRIPKKGTPYRVASTTENFRHYVFWVGVQRLSVL